MFNDALKTFVWPFVSESTSFFNTLFFTGNVWHYFFGTLEDTKVFLVLLLLRVLSSVCKEEMPDEYLGISRVYQSNLIT